MDKGTNVSEGGSNMHCLGVHRMLLDPFPSNFCEMLMLKTWHYNSDESMAREPWAISP